MHVLATLKLASRNTDSQLNSPGLFLPGNQEKLKPVASMRGNRQM